MRAPRNRLGERVHNMLLRWCMYRVTGGDPSSWPLPAHMDLADKHMPRFIMTWPCLLVACIGLV